MSSTKSSSALHKVCNEMACVLNMQIANIMIEAHAAHSCKKTSDKHTLADYAHKLMLVWHMVTWLVRLQHMLCGITRHHADIWHNPSKDEQCSLICKHVTHVTVHISHQRLQSCRFVCHHHGLSWTVMPLSAFNAALRVQILTLMQPSLTSLCVCPSWRRQEATGAVWRGSQYTPRLGYCGQ